MTPKTDLDTLIQACRNVKEIGWGRSGLLPQFAEIPTLWLNREIIEAEYNRLIRLKKRKKKAA